MSWYGINSNILGGPQGMMRKEAGQWHLLTDWVLGKLPNIQCLLSIILIFWLNQKQKNWKWEKAAFLPLFFTPKQGRQHKLQQSSEGELMSEDWWWSTVVMRTLALADQPPGCPACPGEGEKKAELGRALLKCYNHFSAGKREKTSLSKFLLCFASQPLFLSQQE